MRTVSYQLTAYDHIASLDLQCRTFKAYEPQGHRSVRDSGA